jgi:hypothetical protein
MPSNRQIAKDWGVNSGYVDKCVKRGCPTDSFEAAREWRLANQKRAWRKPPPGQAAAIEDDITVPQGPILEDIGTDDILLGTREAVRQSWRLLREALVEGKVSKIGACLSLHSRAVEARVRAQSMVREENERARILIPLNEAQAIARKGYDIIIQRLSTLPQNIAPRANPSSPEHAMDILQSEVTSIMQDVQAAFSK